MFHASGSANFNASQILLNANSVSNGLSEALKGKAKVVPVNFEETIQLLQDHIRLV
jgi:hypothetical protein